MIPMLDKYNHLHLTINICLFVAICFFASFVIYFQNLNTH